MIDIPVYDWPWTVRPRDQLFHVPGQATEGGFTVGGARTLSPEVGGRAVLKWTFDTQREQSEAGRLYSWLISKVSNGSVFRLPVGNSKQLASAEALGIAAPAGANSRGLPWEGDILWSNGQGWEFDPGVMTVGTALEGSTVLTVNFGTLLPGLWHGHVIGIAGRAYKVDDIEYDGSIATITVTPPLRADVAAGDFVTFRPKMYGVCVDPSSFEALFDVGIWIRPGSITFAEAII